jgi:elongation of very long chain fatty acids protein 6
MDLYQQCELMGLNGTYSHPIPVLFTFVERFFAFLHINEYVMKFRNVQGWRDQSVKFFDDHAVLFAMSVLLYPPVIYWLYHIMKTRNAFDLRLPLILWNVFLAMFSFLGAVALIPLIPDSIQNFGWWNSVCTRWCYGFAEGEFLVFLFDISKVFEFVDTIFIVLRKRELIFLHYYHHVSTMLFCWYCNQTSQEFGCHGFYFATMNFFVHFVMYSYYAAAAMRFTIPKIISTFVTIMQIAQMIFGVAIVYTLGTCTPTDKKTLYFGSLLYLSFFLLFAHFFYTKYYLPPKPKREDQQVGRKEATRPKQKSQ